MLTIPRRYDNRLPLAAIASLLVLINASLIGFDVYQRNTSQSPGVFTASNTSPADTNDKDQKQASTPAEEKPSDKQSPSTEATPETEPQQAEQNNASNPNGEPAQTTPESTPQSEPQPDTPVVVDSPPSQGGLTFEPGRGGGSPSQSESPPSSPAPSATSTSPSSTDTSDSGSLDAKKTLDSTVTKVSPLLHEPDTGTTVEIK